MEDSRKKDRRSAGGAMQRRPVVMLAALGMVGIALHGCLPVAPGTWACAAVACALLAMALHRPAPGGACAVLALGVFGCAVSAAQIEAYFFARDDLSAFAGDQRRLAQVELQFDRPLRVIDPPDSGPRWSAQPKQTTTARIVRILTTHGWRDVHGEALVQIDIPDSRLAMGQRIRALGMLQRPAVAMNPGQFDWSSYYRSQRILTELTIRGAGNMAILRAGSASPLARLREQVRQLLARGFTKAQSLDAALLRALVLGDNDPQLTNVREQFRRTGTSHHLAISGMHVAILGMLVYALCKLLRLRPRISALIAVAFVSIYGAVALPSPPVLRSVLAWVAIGLALLGGRRTDPLHLLALSVVAILALHPLDLFDAGFDLSFGTVLGILVFSKHTQPLLEDPDAMIAISTPGGNPPRRLVIMHWARTRIGGPLVIGIIAWIVSMPLIVYHFSQVNPWAVLASLLLAVPVTGSLVAGFCKIILTAICPWLAHTWANLAAIPVETMRHGVDWLARLPGSDVAMPTHSILFIVLYYGLVLLFIVPAARPALKRTMRLGPIGAVLLLALIPLVGGAGQHLGRQPLRLTVLSVGAGQCCIGELPDGRIILIDAGSDSMTDPVRRCILPFLRSRGRLRIDEIWLADSDFDHIGAAAELIRRFHVRRVIIGAAWDRHAAATASGEALLRTLHDEGVETVRLHRGDRLDLGAGAAVNVLWPRPDEPLEMNDSDLVLKLSYARRTVLLPSDVQALAQTELLKQRQALSCDVMLAPHHGSGEATTADFIAAADPLYIVSSNDNSLTQKQIRFEHQIGRRELLRTNRCGAVTIQIDPNGGVTVTPFVRTDGSP